MELLFLGTAAAEGWPAPFCDCPACTEARVRGGRDLRSRSGALLDGVVKVDFNADSLMQMQRAGRDLTHCTTLVFTHQHNDHFVPAELQYRGPHFITKTNLPTLHVYGNETVSQELTAALPNLSELHLELHAPLEPFVETVTPDGTTIFSVPALHTPGALLLRLTRHGKSVLYGHDTGLFPEETVAALAGHPLDLALFDCTYGAAPVHYASHMGIDGVLETIERLRTVGAVTENTQLVATHFSHNGGLLYDELVAQFAPSGIRVAYDGLALQI